MAPPHSDPLPVNIRESFYWSKWLTFSASALIMLCAGLSYSCECLLTDSILLINDCCPILVI